MSERDYKCDLKDFGDERIYIQFSIGFAGYLTPVGVSTTVERLSARNGSKIGVYYEEDVVLRLRGTCRTFEAQLSGRDKEIESLKARNKELEERAGELYGEKLDLKAQLEATKKELELEREVVDFYADRNNWRYSGKDRFNNTFNYQDAELVITGKQRDNIGGKRARARVRERG